MIEIIISYILVGCIIGLITWILDIFIPSNRLSLTGKILILTVILWPSVLRIWIKTSVEIIRRIRHDRS